LALVKVSVAWELERVMVLAWMLVTASAAWVPALARL
jgi:hypothetical protein